MPFIPDDQQQKFKTGFVPDVSGSTQQTAFIENQQPGLLQSFAQSSLNPVRDITSGAVGGILRLSPSFKGAEQARTQAQKIGATPGPSTQEILEQAGAAPSAGQIAGSALATGSLFVPGGSSLISAKGLLPALGRLGVDIGQGFSFGYGSALQDKAEQGDAIKQGLLTGLFTYGINLGAKGLGKLADVITTKLPERLLSPTFRETTESALKRATIKATTGKEVPTLARQALESGVAPGGSKELVNVIKELNDTEEQLKKFVSSGKKLIEVEDKKPYINFLNQVKQSYSGGFSSQTADRAEQFIKQLKSVKGNTIPADTALELKRFIDNMRNTSAFRLDVNLVPKQEQYKAGADSLRTQLRKTYPEVASLLDKEQQFINFKDSIAKESVRRGNSQIFNLFDAIVGGESLGAGFPFQGIGLDAMLRTLQQPSVRGKIGTALFRAGRLASQLPESTTAFAKPIGRLFRGVASTELSQP